MHSKKKTLDKYVKALEKMEDMGEKVGEYKTLLVQQLSCENFFRSELSVCEEDVKNPDLQRDVDGNIILPKSVEESMKTQGRKVATW